MFPRRVESTIVVLTAALAVATSACTRKLLAPSATLTAPVPPDDGRRFETSQPAAPLPLPPKDVKARPRATRNQAPHPAKPAAPARAPLEADATGTMGTSGSVSVVSVKPDASAPAQSVMIQTTSSARPVRKPILGATLAAAAIAFAFRFVPRRTVLGRPSADSPPSDDR